MTDLKRKFQLLSLDCRIAMLRKAMEREPGVTQQWRILMIDYLNLKIERQMLAPVAAESHPVNEKGAF